VKIFCIVITVMMLSGGCCKKTNLPEILNSNTQTIDAENSCPKTKCDKCNQASSDKASDEKATTCFDRAGEIISINFNVDSENFKIKPGDEKGCQSSDATKPDALWGYWANGLSRPIMFTDSFLGSFQSHHKDFFAVLEHHSYLKLDWCLKNDLITTHVLGKKGDGPLAGMVAQQSYFFYKDKLYLEDNVWGKTTKDYSHLNGTYQMIETESEIGYDYEFGKKVSEITINGKSYTKRRKYYEIGTDFETAVGNGYSEEIEKGTIRVEKNRLFIKQYKGKEEFFGHIVENAFIVIPKRGEKFDIKKYGFKKIDKP